jgi:hypothetical protein
MATSVVSGALVFGEVGIYITNRVGAWWVKTGNSWL